MPMGSEVLVGREWLHVRESDREIMDALEAIEKRGSTTRLRDRWVLLTLAGTERHMKVAPAVIHGIREPRSDPN
jgi:hypothetical protein